MNDDLKFLHGNHQEECTAVVDKHYEGYYTIQLISGGAVEAFYEEKRYLFKPGWYWPGFPGPHIRFHAAPGFKSWNHRYVAFCGSLATRWMAEGFISREPQAAPPGWNYVAEFDKLLTYSLSSDRWDLVRARNALERLLIELAACRTRHPTEQPWLTNVIAALSEPGRERVDYAALAAGVGMSQALLRRRFKHETGLSLHAYALQCRITKARSLLSASDLPIKQIAEDLGYQDAYFFSRQFHRLAGVPPAAYRRSCQT